MSKEINVYCDSFHGLTVHGHHGSYTNLSIEVSDINQVISECITASSEAEVASSALANIDMKGVDDLCEGVFDCETGDVIILIAERIAALRTGAGGNE